MSEKLSTQPYKGTRDFYPREMRLRNWFFGVIRQVLEASAFEEYNGPMLESLDLYAAKSGEEIANEQTYNFTDRAERRLAIRPEMTPTVARMVAGKMGELNFPLRWFSLPNMYRYEKPQRGRLREFWQVNVDIFGCDTFEADLECIASAIRLLRAFGADVHFADEYRIEIKPSKLRAYSARIEGDYSNAAFLDAFNCIGSEVKVCGLRADSLQGDRVYREYFEKIMCGTPTLDVSNCPDLAPILIALAALKSGAVLTGTDRLAAKESDRGVAMHEELVKLGGSLEFGENSITVLKQNLAYGGKALDGHNDHRIVMAMSVILSHIGGEIDGIEAVKKSYPRFFEDIKILGAEVEIK